MYKIRPVDYPSLNRVTTSASCRRGRPIIACLFKATSIKRFPPGNPVRYTPGLPPRVRMPPHSKHAKCGGFPWLEAILGRPQEEAAREERTEILCSAITCNLWYTSIYVMVSSSRMWRMQRNKSSYINMTCHHFCSTLVIPKRITIIFSLVTSKTVWWYWTDVKSRKAIQSQARHCLAILISMETSLDVTNATKKPLAIEMFPARNVREKEDRSQYGFQLFSRKN